MSAEFWDAIKHRRTYYDIGDKPAVSDETIRTLIDDALRYTPSAFNMQSARALVLLGAEHKRLWGIVEETLKPVVPQEAFGATQEKLAGFAKGYGTVLFFEEQTIIEGLQAQFALYKDNFPVWSLQASGMAQLVVWTALESAGLGASLQHYNPLIDDKVKAAWNLPATWKLWSQLVFGSINSAPDAREYKFKEGDALYRKA